MVTPLAARRALGFRLALGFGACIQTLVEIVSKNVFVGTLGVVSDWTDGLLVLTIGWRLR